MSAQKPYRRALVLGMDGLDPKRVKKMTQEGRLPTFARLQSEGTLCAMATSNPAESPVAWSSLATGCNPGQHGIFDFLHRNPKGYVPFLSTHREKKRATLRAGTDRFESPRQAEGFWRYTSDAGLPTTVVRWPVTFPAEKVTGNFLSGLGTPDVAGRMGKHTFYTTADVEKNDEKAVHVQWKGESITTSVFGPAIGGISANKPLRCKLIIERTGNGIALRIGDQRHELAPGEWSNWFEVSFKMGPMPICDGIVKFHLVSVGPQLALFATPVQIDPKQQAFSLTEPASYGAELNEKIGSFYTLGLPEDTHAVTDGRYDLDAFLQQCSEISAQRRAMFDYELNRFDEGLLAFVFDAGDRIQHMFWSIADQSSPMYDANLAAKYGGIVDQLYQEMDGILADAVSTLSEDTAIFVVSDHGFGPFHRAVNLNRWLVDNGYMTLKSGGEGRTLFADVDWAKTQAYAVGFTSIYLNVAGRESRGIVKAGAQADALQAELSSRLGQQLDPENNQQVIRSVRSGCELYSGPHASNGPDLVVGFEPGYRASWQTALGAAPHELLVDNDSLWAADHLVDPSAVPGVMASNLQTSCENATVLDLAPTVLAALDVEVPRHMEGRTWLDSAQTHTAKPARDQARDLEPASEALLPVQVGAEADESTNYTADGLDDQQRQELEAHLSDLGYL